MGTPGPTNPFSSLTHLELRRIADKYVLTTEPKYLGVIEIIIQVLTDKSSVSVEDKIKAIHIELDAYVEQHPDLEENVEFFEVIRQFIKGFWVELVNQFPEKENDLTHTAIKMNADFLLIYSDIKEVRNYFEEDVRMYTERLGLPIAKKGNNSSGAIYFLQSFSLNQLKILSYHLKQKGYTKQPSVFIDILNGKTDRQVVIPVEKLPHVAYLLYCLYKHKPQYIRLNSGKGYLQEFSNHISHFSTIAGKSQMKHYNYFVLNKHTPQTQIIREVESIMSALKKAIPPTIL